VKRILRPRLDSKDLHLVLTLASAGSTAKAASSLHLTQSAVSRALLQVEERVGTRLFDRTAQGLAPTVAGQRLLDGAGPVLAQLLALETSLQMPEEKPARLRLVCECYTAYRWLPSAIMKLRTSLPAVELSMVVERTGDPVPALLSGDIDVALLTTAPVHGGLRAQPLFTDEIVFVMSSAHPLASHASIEPEDLAKYPMVGGDTPPAERRWFLSKVFGRKVPPLQRLQFPLTEAVMDAVRAGMGIAAMSEWIAGPYLGGSAGRSRSASGTAGGAVDVGGGFTGGGDLVIRRLTSGRLIRPWRIAYRRETEPLAETIASALADCAPRIYV
jgi:LysR family transcriptional regulator, regulator for metE and metH